jgi:hypothetical protein
VTPLDVERIRYSGFGKSLRRRLTELFRIAIVIAIAPVIIAVIVIKPDWFAPDESDLL